MRRAPLACVVACNANPSKLDHIGAAPAKPPAPDFPLAFDAAAIDTWVASQIAERSAVGASLVAAGNPEDRSERG